MGWFHDTFGFSSQPAVQAVNDAVGDSWNTIGQGFGDVAGTITGSQKVEDIFSPPTWEELGKPGEAFYNEFNEGAGVLPPSWRQYAAPAVSTALNFVPGVGPLLSAGFTTAYNAGGMQANQKGMDWGKVGKDAAINFGTAAAQMGASKLTSNVNANAQNAADFRTSPSGMRAGFDASQPALGWKEAATANAGGLPKTASTMSAFSAAPASFGMPSGAEATAPSLSSAASTDSLSKLQFSPTDRVYKAAVGAGSNVAGDALASTLAPQGATPLSGFYGAEGEGTDVNGYNFGDELSAFGDAGVLNTPNPTGPRIGSSEVDAMVSRRGANAYLQQMGARDQALPAGQTLPEPNTPYANRLTEINQGADKSMEDLSNEIRNYNAYWGIRDANPQITDEMMNGFMADPTTVPQNMQPYFQGIQPMSMFNTSMIR